MNESGSFSVHNMNKMCRACLKVAEEVFPMSILEINGYQNLTQKIFDTNMYLCVLCKWVLNKCIKFTEQCQKAHDILCQLPMDTKSHTYLQVPSMYDLKISSLTTLNLGPAYDLDFEEKDEYLIDNHIDDNDDDDDEIPLVMLQDEYKYEREKLQSFEDTPEIEIKIESEIKQENTEDICDKVRRSKKKKKKEIKEGFSSRMVQETEEYVVIKLTKEQVLSELSEKAKADSYIRSPFKCERCVKGFNFEDVLQTHMEKHTLEHGSYKCDICTQYCPSSVSLRGHLKSHTTRYKCKLCGQVRLSRQHLLEHHAITHTSAPITYTCDKCQFTTNKRTVIQRHVKTHSWSERHACHRCGKMFTTIESLRVHTMRHDKSKRLQCSHCEKQFIYPSLLHKHIQAVHERKDYYCVECDVRFKSSESLRLHFKKAKRHRDSSSYKHECAQCPQRFVSASTLSVHLSSVHGAPREHQCAQCTRRYSSREALRAHAWRVHTRAECAHCGGDTRKSVSKISIRSASNDLPRCECKKNTLKTNHATKNQKNEGLLPNGAEDMTNMPQEG